MKKEKYKSKAGLGIFLILFGLMFTVLNLLALIEERNFEFGVLIFIIVGISVLVGGILYFINDRKKGKIINDLIYRNEYIYAEFDSVREVYHSGQETDYYTYYALFRYESEYSQPVFFKSEEYSNPKKIPFKPGDSAKVFVDMSNPEVYMVSTNDTLHSDDPRYIECEKGDDKISAFISIVFGSIFVLVPLPIAASKMLSMKTNFPGMVLCILFFGLFIAVGAAQIVKGIKELTKKQ